MEKISIVSVTYENESISIKNSLHYIKCVLRGPWADLWPFYGLYSKRFSLSINLYIERKPFTGDPLNGHK